MREKLKELEDLIAAGELVEARQVSGEIEDTVGQSDEWWELTSRLGRLEQEALKRYEVDYVWQGDRSTMVRRYVPGT